jgi:ferrochelatase
MEEKIAVVLFQLGGPDSAEAIEPFLYNLFCDPDIIDFPGAFLGRRLLAKFISLTRSATVQHHYEEIGGQSPILDLTNRQAAALQRSLLNEGLDATTFVAMRYWHPMTEEVIRAIQGDTFDRIILLPLYAQFSKATTYSSVNEWNRRVQHTRLNGIPTQLICCYPNHPQLLDAFVDRVNEAFARFKNIRQEEIDLLFSAHGLPVNFVAQGDPYQLQIEESVHRVLERGRWKSPHTLCYQSKVGRQEWLGPTLLNTIEHRSQQGRRRMIVIPIAFVTEHIETLHEINLEAREHAKQCGVEQFEMMPALNDHPKFIACLTDLVLARIHSRTDPVSKCAKLRRENPQRPVPLLCPWYRVGDRQASA